MHTYSDDDDKYKIFCCCHIRRPTVVLASLTIVFCLGCIAVLCVAFVFKDFSLHLMVAVLNIKQHCDKNPTAFDISYQAALGLFICGNVMHITTISVMLTGVKLVRPSYFVLEFIVMGLFLGLLMFASIALLIIMIMSVGFVLIPVAVDVTLALYFIIFLWVILRCYHFLGDKRLAMLQSMYYRTPKMGRVTFND